jgi:hypothetical protein
MRSDLPPRRMVIILIPILLAVLLVLFGPRLAPFIRESPDWLRFTTYGMIAIVIVLGEIIYRRFRSNRKDD